MSISQDDLEYTAKLAKLGVQDSTAEDLTSKMSTILSYFKKLEEVQTEHVEPTTLLEPEWGTKRGDEQTTPLSQDQALANAPDNSDGHFVVPRVL